MGKIKIENITDIQETLDAIETEYIKSKQIRVKFKRSKKYFHPSLKTKIILIYLLTYIPLTSILSVILDKYYIPAFLILTIILVLSAPFTIKDLIQFIKKKRKGDLEDFISLFTSKGIKDIDILILVKDYYECSFNIIDKKLTYVPPKYLKNITSGFTTFCIALTTSLLTTHLDKNYSPDLISKILSIILTLTVALVLLRLLHYVYAKILAGENNYKKHISGLIDTLDSIILKHKIANKIKIG